MARVYSSEGDYKKAITYINVALRLAPDDGVHRNAENLLKRLEGGQDINK